MLLMESVGLGEQAMHGLGGPLRAYNLGCVAQSIDST